MVTVGVNVGVGVTVGVLVGLRVGVRVAVNVGMAVGVAVGVALGAFVGVAVGPLHSPVPITVTSSMFQPQYCQLESVGPMPQRRRTFVCPAANALISSSVYSHEPPFSVALFSQIVVQLVPPLVLNWTVAWSYAGCSTPSQR